MHIVRANTWLRQGAIQVADVIYAVTVLEVFSSSEIHQCGAVVLVGPRDRTVEDFYLSNECPTNIESRNC